MRNVTWHMTVLAVATFLIPALTCSADVTVVGDKCVLVDGKPFFPIGVYSAGGARDFPILAEAGFNTVHSYAWEGKRHNDTGMQWLDDAHANGLMALVGLYRPEVKKMDWTSSIERIATFRDHPALLAWHTMDEPSWDREEDSGKDYMPAAYALLKEHDPDHPVTAVVCHFGDTTLFEPSVDVMQADYYPIPPIPADWYSGTGFHGIKLFVDKWRAASGGAKPFWFVCQIFDFSVSKEETNEIPDEWKRLPTGQELRAMTYTAVAAGAKGILYWSLSRLIGDDWARGILPRVKFWEQLKSVVGELNVLMPVLTADTPEIIADNNRVATLIKSDGRDTYIIAVNYERSARETLIELPTLRQGLAQAVFGQGEFDLADGKLEMEFEPLEVKVLRLVGVTQP